MTDEMLVGVFLSGFSTRFPLPADLPGVRLVFAMAVAGPGGEVAEVEAMLSWLWEELLRLNSHEGGPEFVLAMGRTAGDARKEMAERILFCDRILESQFFSASLWDLLSSRPRICGPRR